MPYNADNVPSHVPKTRAAQWAAVWDNVYNRELADGDTSRDEAEARAFEAANAILSNRSITLKQGEFVSWTTDDGARRRGEVMRLVDAERKDGDALSLDDLAPLVEVQAYRPVRDGWEKADGDPVQVKLDDCTKIEALYAPSRVTRKQVDQPISDDTLKAVIDAAVSAALDAIKAAPPLPTSPLQIKRLGQDRIGGYALVYGDHLKRDIEGDYFTPETDLWLDVYRNQPIMFDHAVGTRIPDWAIPDDADPDHPRHYKLGRIVDSRKDDVGLWVEAVIDEHNDWVEGVWQLIDKGALFFSSGSVPHLIKRTEDGAVKSWPIIEVSLTPTPAEPRNTLVRKVNTGSIAQASREALGKSQRAPAKTAQSADNVPTQHSGGSVSMKNKKRLQALITAHLDDALSAGVAAYKAATVKAKASLKEGDPEEIQEAQEEAVAAATQLDELLNPITEQAKSVLGIEPSEVRKALLKMAFAKEGLAEEELVEEPPVEEFTDAEDDMVEGDDYLEDLDMPMMEEEEDFTEEGDIFEEEEEEAMLSSRPRRSTVTRRTDIERAVANAMKRLPAARKGSFKAGTPDIIVRRERKESESLSGFLKAVRDRNRAILQPGQLKAKSAYKALGINPDTSGGYLVPPEHATEIIELLRNKSIFLRAEGDGEAPGESLVTVLPLNRDVLFIPRQSGASTAYWTGENAQIVASEQTVGQIQLIAKKLACLVKVSNELLADASYDVDNFIRADIAKVMSREVDRSVLYGAGVNGEPLGIKNYPGVTLTALNAAPTYDNLTAMVSRVEEANVDDDGTWKWLLNPRDKNAFRRLQDGAGQYVFAGDALTAAQNGVPRQLLGYEWMSSNVVTKTGSPVETDVFFGKWSDVIIGMRQTIEVVASDVAGDSFEYDQTWIRAILRTDIQMRHSEAIEVLTDVREVVTV